MGPKRNTKNKNTHGVQPPTFCLFSHKGGELGHPENNCTESIFPPLSVLFHMEMQLGNHLNNCTKTSEGFCLFFVFFSPPPPPSNLPFALQ